MKVWFRAGGPFWTGAALPQHEAAFCKQTRFLSSVDQDHGGLVTGVKKVPFQRGFVDKVGLLCMRGL